MKKILFFTENHQEQMHGDHHECELSHFLFCMRMLTQTE